MSAGDSTSPVLDFTSLDYASVQTDLIAFAQARFPSELWTDFNDSDWAIFLVQLLAYCTDLLSYNANAELRETLISTLIREQSFRNIGKSFDYTLASATASNSTETLTLDPLGSYPFTISKHLQFATADGIVFQPDSDLVVPSFVATVTVDITQGVESFQENVGTTNGTPGQQFQLGTAFLIDETLSVLVGAQPYTSVPNSIVSGPTDKTFTIATDENGITTITLGDGINGTLPGTGQTVFATYKTGGGSNTNLSAGTITRVIGTSDGSRIPPQILSVTNSVRAQDGGPKQSLASAKANLPLSLKANDRAVTLQDYSTLTVLLVPGVLAANAVKGITFGGSSVVLIFVVPQGGGVPSPTLKNLIISALSTKKLAGKRIQIVTPVYVSMQVAVDMFAITGALSSAISARVSGILLNKYGLDNSTFGPTEEVQDAYRAVDPQKVSIPGAERALFRKFTVAAYASGYVNRPVAGFLGSTPGTVDVITTSPNVQRREWAIFGGSGNTFTVLQRQLGTVTALTDTIMEDEAADFEVNGLLGWNLHLLPQEQDNSEPIISNGDTAIVVSGGGLLSFGEVGDQYAVERAEPLVGQIVRTNPTTTAAAGQPAITVASVSQFSPGNLVLLRDVGFPPAIATIQTLVGNVITLTSNLTFPLSTSATVDWYWQSDDGTVGFALISGSAPFQVGDRLYVDTFPLVGDIALRPENFPILNPADLVVRVIGGT